jgi:hypothetical protein
VQVGDICPMVGIELMLEGVIVTSETAKLVVGKLLPVNSTIVWV